MGRWEDRKREKGLEGVGRRQRKRVTRGRRIQRLQGERKGRRERRYEKMERRMVGAERERERNSTDQKSR